MTASIAKLLTRLAAVSTTLPLIALCAFAQQPTAAPASQPSLPKVVMPFTSYSFNDVYRGEVVSQIFIIKNAGTADLIIKDFTVSCSCEVVEWDKVIPPGKEGKARIELNTALAIGGSIRTATLHTNDPERPSIVLTIIVNVLSNPDGSPIAGATLREGKYIGPVFVGPGLRWGKQIKEGEKANTQFDFSVERGPLKIVRIEGDQAHFAARLDTVEDGKAYKLIVENVPTDAPGRYDTQLRIITDSALLPYFEIRLFLVVAPREGAKPKA
jgi:hypothetical protein